MPDSDHIYVCGNQEHATNGAAIYLRLKNDGGVKFISKIDTPQQDYCRGITYDAAKQQLSILLQSAN